MIEPELGIEDNNNDYTNNLKKNRYIGKTIYLNITLKSDLTKNCESTGCLLCFANNYSCITAKPDTSKIELNTMSNIKMA